MARIARTRERTATEAELAEDARRCRAAKPRRFTTVDELMDMMSRVTGRRKPLLRLPAPVMAAISEVTTRVFKVLAPKSNQRLTPGAVRILRMCRKADISKAKDELGYRPTSIEEAIREQYEWFVSDGQIRGKSGTFVPRAHKNGKSAKPIVEMGATL